MNKENYFSLMQQQFWEMHPLVEQEFDLKLEGIRIKTMEAFYQDFTQEFLDQGLRLDPSTASSISFYLKALMFAVVPVNMLEHNIYFNTAKHIRFFTSKKSLNDKIRHELYHFVEKVVAPDFFREVPSGENQKQIMEAMKEGFAYYFTFHSPMYKKDTLRRLRKPLENPRKGWGKEPEACGYRFFKTVCEEKGQSFALEVLKHPPKTYSEINEPAIYLQQS